MWIRSLGRAWLCLLLGWAQGCRQGVTEVCSVIWGLIGQQSASKLAPAVGRNPAVILRASGSCWLSPRIPSSATSVHLLFHLGPPMWPGTPSKLTRVRDPGIMGATNLESIIAYNTSNPHTRCQLHYILWIRSKFQVPHKLRGHLECEPHERRIRWATLRVTSPYSATWKLGFRKHGFRGEKLLHVGHEVEKQTKKVAWALTLNKVPSFIKYIKKYKKKENRHAYRAKTPNRRCWLLVYRHSDVSVCSNLSTVHINFSVGHRLYLNSWFWEFKSKFISLQIILIFIIKMGQDFYLFLEVLFFLVCDEMQVLLPRGMLAWGLQCRSSVNWSWFILGSRSLYLWLTFFLKNFKKQFFRRNYFL